MFGKKNDGSKRYEESVVTVHEHIKRLANRIAEELNHDRARMSELEERVKQLEDRKGAVE